MEQPKYDVFISYSRKDYVDEKKNVIPGNEVSKIKETLTEAGITYWFDEDGIYSGQNFVDKIVTNIENSRVFLFLSTANANKSPWTCKEIASADEFKKHIIPVRIDDTPYNKTVLFRIANLDYIDYYTNPQKGMENMIKSIKAFLKEQVLEEDREEQAQLVEDIRSSSSILNIEETKLELERSKLLVKTEKVKDREQRESLKTEITDGSPIRKKTHNEIKKLQDHVAELEAQAQQLENHPKNPKMPLSTLNKWWHVGYGCIILVLLSVACHRSCEKATISDEISENNGIIEFSVDDTKFNMVLVEGGSFMMGSPNNDSVALEREKPQHRVTLSQYYIGETEVTQALWKAVMGDNPSNWKGENLPVEFVSWDDCQEFIKQLNKKTGKAFRLPTEAEWEVAARGGRKSEEFKYAGSYDIGKVGWYYDNCNEQTHPVKQKAPNELGLYDMSGNVLEWCQDWYGAYSDSILTNPSGPSSGSFRVLRGGSWGNEARYCRVAARGRCSPDLRNFVSGFRLALVHP